MAIDTDTPRITDQFTGTTQNITTHLTGDGSNWVAAKGPFAVADASQMTVTATTLRCAMGFQNAVICTRPARSADQWVEIYPQWLAAETGDVYILLRWSEGGAFPSGYALKLTRVGGYFKCFYQRYNPDGTKNLDLMGYGGVMLYFGAGTTPIIDFSVVGGRFVTIIANNYTPDMDFTESSPLIQAGYVGFAMEVKTTPVTNLLFDNFWMWDDPVGGVVPAFWTDYVKASEQDVAGLLSVVPQTITPVVVQEPTVGLRGSGVTGFNVFVFDHFDQGAGSHSPLVHTSNVPGGTTWVAAKGPFATASAANMFITGTLRCTAGFSNAILSTAVPFSVDEYVYLYPQWETTETGELYILLRWDESGPNPSGYALKVTRVGSTQFRSWFQRYNADGSSNLDMEGTGGRLHDYGFGNMIEIEFFIVGSKLSRWLGSDHTPADELVDGGGIMQLGRVGVALRSVAEKRYLSDFNGSAYPTPVIPTAFWTEYVKAREVDA